MTTITVRYAYCPEHAARHMVDENENHIANNQAEMKARGYFYLRHIGGGWFSYREPVTAPLPLDWQILADAHANHDEIDIDF